MTAEMPREPIMDQFATAGLSENIVLAAFRDVLEQRPTPGLYLVATPIGNLGDVSLRALALLAACDHLYCEDRRVSRRLLSRFGITRTLRSYHEHNAEKTRPKILADLAKGSAVTLISDAGTPGISDPGFKLVREAIAAGYSVVPVPGPTAAIAALSASGLPTDRFFFIGFLPSKRRSRRQQLGGLATIPASLIFYESPHRLADTLEDLRDVFGDRQAAIARELTKKFEAFERGSLEDLVALSSHLKVRGEVTLVVGPPDPAAKAAATDAEVLDRLVSALDTMRPSQAAKIVAEDLGVAKSRVYELALKLRRERM
ncbi:MAG: 16S rRNA (cytidine(1402)-2'-O)-methyltransferase [Hyphomicrobiaceae bacterium]